MAQPPDLAALMRGLSAPPAGGGPNPMAAMMQQMGPMMQQMAAGRGGPAAGPGRPGGAPPNPMAMMQAMMGGAGGGGAGGGEPDIGAMMGSMMQSMGPMIQSMKKNMERSQSAPHMQRRKSAAAPPLQLGPIEDCLASVHAELLNLVLVAADQRGSLSSAEVEQARRLSMRRLVGGVQAAFAELRQMMVGLANLLKEPAYRSDAAFRSKVGKLGEIVAASLGDLGVAITTATELLQARSPPVVRDAAGSGSGGDSDEFQSAEEEEEAAEAPPVAVPTSPPAPALKKPGTARAPSQAVMAAAQSSGDGWMKELPESERELWRSVINADARRQQTQAAGAGQQGQNRRRVSRAYNEMGLGKAKAKAKPSAIHTLMTNPEAMGGSSSTAAAAPPVAVPAPDIAPMRGWHEKAKEGDDKGENGETLSYEEQIAAQAKAARANRIGGSRGKRRKKQRSSGATAAAEPEPEPEHMGEID